MDHLEYFVLYRIGILSISKSKHHKNKEKRQKSRKMTFLAFFRYEGKFVKFYAILREYKSYINPFISVDKPQNLASRSKIVLMKINVK